MAPPKLKIEMLPIEKVLNYARNARMHDDAQVKAIAASITEFGFINPCLVDPDGVLIAGHGRVLALKHLGHDTVPVIKIGHLSEDQIKALRIADNQLPMLASWNADLLRIELNQLSMAGYEMKLLGFDDIQLVSFMSGVPESNNPEALPTDTGPITTRRNDLWLLGKHRLFCGNSLERSDIDRLLINTIPDIANCDPPYGISIVKAAAVGDRKAFGSVGGTPSAADRKHIGNFSKKPLGRGHALGKAGFGRVPVNAAKAIIQTGVYAEVIGDDSTQTAIASYQLLKEIGIKRLVLWGGNYYAEALPPSRCWFVWDKEVSGSFADVELAWTNCDQVARLFRHQWNGLMKASEKGERRVHPTQKPVALAEWVIETAAPQAKTYLDLFMGSGSSLIACERKSIKCFGMEMAEIYCDIVVKRWQIYTNSEATLDGDGRTFAQIAKSRASGSRKPKPPQKPAQRAKRKAGTEGSASPK